jgi:dTDP-4-amino-4,6-dideoxygalactose transaminase
MIAIERVATRHNLAIVEDCCQAHVATAGGRPVGTIGAAGAFSFYPTKNLGALGDGGAVVTNDRALADRVMRLRNGGQTDRYHHQEPGINSRLDDLQAAILRARLPRLRGWTERRRALAARYRSRLAGAPVGLLPERDNGHVYHLFVVTTGERDALQAHLAAKGIETLIHYPVPIPRQPALTGEHPADCPVATRLCGEILSLPLHPALRDDEVDEIAAAVHAFQPRTVVS